MISPSAASAEAAEREANTLFDGVLPPFSNVGNTERGKNLPSPQLRGIGYAADFSTSNPTSAYDTTNFGSVSIDNKDVIANPKTGKNAFAAAQDKLKGQGGPAPQQQGTQRAPQKRGGFFGR